MMKTSQEPRIISSIAQKNQYVHVSTPPSQQQGEHNRGSHPGCTAEELQYPDVCSTKHKVSRAEIELTVLTIKLINTS